METEQKGKSHPHGQFPGASTQLIDTQRVFRTLSLAFNSFAPGGPDTGPQLALQAHG